MTSTSRRTSRSPTEAVELLGERAELFVYPGDQHLFTDRSLPSYDAESAALVTQRILAFLDRL